VTIIANCLVGDVPTATQTLSTQENPSKTSLRLPIATDAGNHTIQGHTMSELGYDTTPTRSIKFITDDVLKFLSTNPNRVYIVTLGPLLHKSLFNLFTEYILDNKFKYDSTCSTLFPGTDSLLRKLHQCTGLYLSQLQIL
jgi:hypothetical protein